jgi:hypothetical protein
LKDEIEKKSSIIQKNSEKQQLKEWRSTLKREINFIFDWRVKLKRKLILKKRLKNQKNEDQNWHKNKNKFLIEGWNWK